MTTAADPKERSFQLMEKLWNDKNLGPQIQSHAKEMFPDVKTNEDVYGPALAPLREQNEKLMKMVEEMREERNKDRESRDEEKRGAEMLQRLQSAAASYSLTEEGLDKAVARMKETGNYADPEAAVAWVASKAPPKDVKGPTWASPNANLFGTQEYDEAMAGLHRNADKYLDDQMWQFIQDPDSYAKDTNEGRWH